MARKRKKRKVRPVLMTERRVRNYLKRVHEIGVSRRATQGDKFNPADFAAGAGVLLKYLHCLHLLPASWVFGMMLSGRDPFAPEGG